MNSLPSLIIAFVLVSTVTADILFNDGLAMTFLGRRLIDLIEWIAFWR